MFSLTRQERQVIIFLFTLALLGMGINILVKIDSKVKIIASFDKDIGKINLNTADKDLLMSVPGIGVKLTQAIIEYREKQSGFSSVEELRNIKGITAFRYEKIKDAFIIRQ